MSFTSVVMPKAHPLRQVLNDEVHSRPTEALWRQERVFHIAVTGSVDVLSAWPEHLQRLADEFSCHPAADMNWSAPQINLSLSDSVSALRARFERHNEFVSFSLFERADDALPFDRSAAQRLSPTVVGEFAGRVASGH
jgi:hypothetical protein